MTGSYFARLSSEMAGVVAIGEDYRRAERAFVSAGRYQGCRLSGAHSQNFTASSLPARSDTSPSEFRNTSARFRRSPGRRSHKNSLPPAVLKYRKHRRTENPTRSNAVPPIG